MSNDLMPRMGKTIKITDEVHKMLVELSSSKVETFSDVIKKLGEHYKRTHPKK